MVGLTSAAGYGKDLPIAPPPRVVQADGSRDPAPESENVRKEDPREVVDRIIKNSNAVGDKLAMTDTGKDTRKTQDTILKDIDKLLDQDNPSPKSSQDQNQQNDSNQSKDKSQQNGSNDKKQEGKGGGMSEPKDEGMGGGGGGGDQPKKRRPRQGESQAKAEPKDNGKKQAGGGGGKQQQQTVQGGKPKETRAGGVLPDPKGKKPPPSDPLLPTEDDVVKDVWGHLPDKLRQQASQYYKQEIMPRYAELLKRYYSSMSEKK
ncbi:MAG TPA: hypothetical protein VLM40_23300 [Gemmata sp.]|nr:hypothetical protein [Gemmata sp.]